MARASSKRQRRGTDEAKRGLERKQRDEAREAASAKKAEERGQTEYSKSRKVFAMLEEAKAAR